MCVAAGHRVLMSLKDSTNTVAGPTRTASLDEFARRYTPALRRYFRKRESRQADVDDLVQEVFVRLAGRSSGAAIERPEVYLLRTAGNVWRDFLRKKKTHLAGVHDEYRDDLYPLEDRSPEHVVQGQQTVEAVISALNELPDRTRQVFVLCRVEGMRQQAVASRLGVSISSVEKHMIKAVAHLADCLGNRQ